jgi:hypothetical protein
MDNQINVMELFAEIGRLNMIIQKQAQLIAELQAKKRKK